MDVNSGQVEREDRNVGEFRAKGFYGARHDRTDGIFWPEHPSLLSPQFHSCFSPAALVAPRRCPCI